MKLSHEAGFVEVKRDAHIIYITEHAIAITIFYAKFGWNCPDHQSI
jgi:hypothetical protein